MALKENIQLCHALIDSPTRWNFSITLFLILFIHLFFTFQMTMKGSKLALLLLLVVALEMLLFPGSDALWWRRRRRRRCSTDHPSYPKWENKWRQDFDVKCKNGKKSFSQFLRLTYIFCYIYVYLHLLVQHTSNELMIWLSRKLKFRFHLSCLQNKILWTYTRTKL